MNNKGFTLTELLITLALLSVLGIIVANNIVGISNKEDRKAELNFIEKVENAACVYADLSDSDIMCQTGNCLVEFKTLIENGLLDGELVYPNTNKTIDNKDKVQITHNFSNIKECIYNFNNDYDTIPPTITVETKKGLIKISVSDNKALYGYQINQYSDLPLEYSKVKNSKETYVTEIVPKSTDIMYIHAIDMVGNYNSYKLEIDESLIDKEPPSIVITSIIQGKVTYTLKDNVLLSGYKITDSSDRPDKFITNDENVGSQIINKEGTYYIHAIDSSNNYSNKEFYVDLTKPQVSGKFELIDNSGYINMNISDDIALNSYLVLNSPIKEDNVYKWTTISGNNFEYNYPIDKSGDYYIYGRDNQGNISDAYKLSIDLDKPEIKTIFINSETQEISFTFTDNIGLKDYSISLNSSFPTEWKQLSGKEAKLVEKVDLSGLYYIYVRDTSNNYSLKNAQITIDNTTEWIFKYDSDERIREFRIPRSGKYLVEVIGGRGGNNIQENNPSLNCAKNYSGYGWPGQVSAVFNFPAGLNLYVIVGGNGGTGTYSDNGCSEYKEGSSGYNGGIKGKNGSAGSGGASQISLTNDLYSEEFRKSGNLLISAQGGAGYRYCSTCDPTVVGGGINYINDNSTYFVEKKSVKKPTRVSLNDHTINDKPSKIIITYR